MEEILAAIRDALERKGISEAAASQAAGGNPSVIKNFRTITSTKRAHPIENLLKVAEVLDLEFYFGPPRKDAPASTPTFGLAESRAIMDNPDLAPKPDQLFLPIPYSSRAGDQKGVAPIAFLQDWFEGLGRPPDNLTFLVIDTDHMAPALPAGAMALVDEAERDPFAPHATDHVFAIEHAGQRTARRISAAQGDLVVFTNLNPAHPATICKRTDLITTHRIIGQVVWASAVIT